jgi:hypothetical protein
LTARRSSKKSRRKSPAKRDQSAPRSRIPEAEEKDEWDVLETTKQLEERLALADRITTDLASRYVDALMGRDPVWRHGDDAPHIQLRKREPDDIALAVHQFARSSFEGLFADANSKSSEFGRRIKKSDALRDLIGCDQLSLEQIGKLLEALTYEYMMGLEIGFSPREKSTEQYSTLLIPELEKRTETFRAAAQYLLDDSHSGGFAGSLRDKKLASQLPQLVFNYSFVLKIKKQMQQELFGQPRKRGRPQTPFGRFAGTAYQILDPLPDRKRRDLILTFDHEFFGGKTNPRKLLNLLTKAGVRQPRPVD